ncbi:MAG: hypothetical protein ACKVZJ_00250 [Phycisphaerales bacterium]
MKMSRRLMVGALAVACAAGSALACGTPPKPPPPPPEPPIVYCQPIRWVVDPTNPNFDCIIVRYFRLDGQPLYRSNPMPLPATQQCACSLPPLPTVAVGAGAQIVGISFGAQPDCALPPDAPGYGPWTRNNNPGFRNQVQNFYSAYGAAAGGTIQPPAAPSFFDIFSFSGPGNIPPNVTWDIYQYIRVPRGFDPSVLAIPGQAWLIGLFLIDGTQVLAEPSAQGLPPIPFSQFAQNPGDSAFYKFCWLPNTLPPPCPCPPTPPTCIFDSNNDGVINVIDLTAFLAAFGSTCPPVPLASN